MAAKFLLPGFGGRYTSETLTSTAATGADTIDASNMRQLAFQITSTDSPAGNIDIQQSFNGAGWSALVSNIALTDGTVALLDENDGPFGNLRIDGTDITAGNIVVSIVGVPYF